MNDKLKIIIINEENKDYESLPKPQLSVRARKNLNRMFREVVGSSNIPYPDVDNSYEIMRSFIVRKINILKHKMNIDK